MSYLIHVGLFALLASVCLAATTTTPTTTTTAPINPTCYLNNTVLLNNPDPGRLTYISAYSNATGAACTVAADQNNQIITIEDCDIFNTIEVAFSESSAIITSQGYVASVVCKDIAEEGVLRNLTQKFTPILNVTSVTSVTPNFGISSALRENSHLGNKRISAHLTTPLYWTIDVPAQYYGRPRECWAFPGSSVNRGRISKRLQNAGCSLELDLVLDFSQANSSIVGAVRRYWAIFYTFKFYNSDYLTLWCNVDICAGVSGCDISCSRTGREADKGSAGVEQVIQTLTTLHLTGSQFGMESSSPAFTYGTTWILAIPLLLIGQVFSFCL